MYRKGAVKLFGEVVLYDLFFEVDVFVHGKAKGVLVLLLLL
jgi:hypothetical protein